MVHRGTVPDWPHIRFCSDTTWTPKVCKIMAFMAVVTRFKGDTRNLDYGSDTADTKNPA